MRLTSSSSGSIPRTRNQDLWTADVAHPGTFDPVTTNPAPDQSGVWSIDGRSVIASTARDGVGGIYQLSATGGKDVRLLEGPAYPGDVSRDGLLFFLQRGETTRLDIWALPLSGNRRAYPIVNSEFNEFQPQVSFDGRWLAYASDLNGQSEIYVSPLKDGKALGATRIAFTGGVAPRWRSDGQELFYIAAPRSLTAGHTMRAPFKTNGLTFQAGAATELFPTSMMPGGTGVTRDYDVTRDGQRFLVGTVTGEAKKARVTIIFNWMAAMKK